MEVDTTWNCNLWKPKRRRRRGNNNENSRGTLRPKRTKRDAKNIELKPNLQTSFLKQCSSQKYLNLLERLYSERFRKALYQRMWCTASTETPRVRPQRRKFVVIVMIDPYFYFKDLSSCVHILRQLIELTSGQLARYSERVFSPKQANLTAKEICWCDRYG